ncbi:hypothetical protein CFP56_033008 [Quercus suber]|uniref:Uncharacterized protein n=1 Tax=Quercus suber TaxID=58331 RepID=A0AAW0JFE0_QUESU
MEGVVAMESSTYAVCEDPRTSGEVSYGFPAEANSKLREIREIKVEDDPSELHLLDKRDWDPCQDDQMVDLFSFIDMKIIPTKV